MVSLWKKIKALVASQHMVYKPAYRVAHFEQDDSGNYYVVVQVIGKSITYTMQPEKLLADDRLVRLFSPIDIRTLTYLGYLGINGPKYKILAKQLAQDNDQTLFALYNKQRGSRHIVSASEISSNSEILAGLSQTDAHMVGFTNAMEQQIVEQKQKEFLRHKPCNNSHDSNSK